MFRLAAYTIVLQMSYFPMGLSPDFPIGSSPNFASNIKQI